MDSETKMVQVNPSNKPQILKDTKQKSQFSSLFRFTDLTDKLMMTAGVIGSLLMGASLPVFANLLGTIIDAFNNGDVYSEAKRVMLIFVYLGIATLVVGTITNSLWNISATRQASQCRRQYFRSVLSQEVGWFDTNSQAQITTAFAADNLTFEQAIGQKISILVYLLGMILSAIGLSLYRGWILALIVIGYLPLLLIAWAKNVRARQATFTEHKQIYDESDKKAQQSLSAIKLVKQMNAEDFQTAQQESILKRVTDTFTSLGRQFACAAFFAYASLYLCFVLGLWYGMQCISESNLCPQSISTSTYTAGTVVQVLYALIIPTLSLNQLTPSLQKINEGLYAMTRINFVLGREPLIKNKENAIIPDKFTGIFRFQDVSFAYPKDKSRKILNHFNLCIDGRHTVITGKSGQGKSTIFQLIMRYYDPDEGIVYLDDIDLKDIDLNWLRKQIGYVGQEPVLFATSIRENLLLARKEATETEIYECLRKVEAFDFVNDLKDKLDTFVGSQGDQLSGGQKQRIAIARALLKQPKLILMDEATSALDTVNEKHILKALKTMENEYRTISITHRKRVIRTCDKIYEFGEDGKVNIVEKQREEHQKKKKGADLGNFLKVENNEDNNDQSSRTNLKSQGQKSSIHDKAIEQQTSKHQEAIETSGNYWKLCHFMMSHKCLSIASIIFAMIDGIMMPLMGVIVGHTIAYLLEYTNNPSYYHTQLMKLIYWGIALAIVAGITHAIAVWTGAQMGQRVIRKIRLEVFDKLVKLPMRWFNREQNQYEKVISQLTANCKIIHSFLSLELQFFIIILFNIIYAILGALCFDWRTGLSTFGLLPLILLSQIIQLGFIQGFTQEKGKFYGDASQIFNESVMNIRTVLSLDALQESSRRYQIKLQRIFGIIFKKSLVSAFMFGVSNLLMYLALGLTFFLSVVFVTNYSITVANSLSSVFLIFLACLSAGSKSNSLQNLAYLGQATSWIFHHIELENQQEILNKQGSKQLTSQIKGNIQFQNVWFKYQNRDSFALEGFSLKIKEGDEAVLVGTSGCGKSTIIALLQGLYFPEKGSIFIEGIDIRDYSLKHLRQCFGVVGQQPRLFDESIFWNIRYDMLNAKKADIYEAAMQANVIPKNKDILSSEEGNESAGAGLVVHIRTNIQIQSHIREDLQRKVGPKGCHVSGGQKQRIAIARTALRHPRILLLDQVTSALDPENQQIVEEALAELMKGKTIVNVTHKLDILKEKQKIVVVKQGKVVEEGSYRDLMMRNGEFAGMVTIRLTQTYHQ